MQIKRKRNTCGQATIDMVLIFMAMSIIFFAALQMFIWFNRCLVERQEKYDTAAGMRITPIWNPPKLYLIKGEEPVEE